MQLTTLLSTLALTMSATALPAADVPAAVQARTHPDPTPNPDPSVSVCNNNSKPVCCNGGGGLLNLLGLVNCAVSVLGGNCAGSSYCCNTEAPVGTLINVQLLNCLNL